MNSLKADMYKFYWEKRGVLPSLLIGLLVLLFYLFFKSSNENDPVFRVLISNVSGFIPLLFISANLFFWGEDYSFRTINILLTKEKQRWKLFLYKTLGTICLSFLYVTIFYSLTALVYLEGDLVLIVSTFLHQLPYYLVIISISLLIFQIFDKVYESCMIYTLYILLFDNLLVYVLPNYGESVKDYLFMTLNLKASADISHFTLINVCYPIVVSLAVIVLALAVFSKKEFK
ncbi:ABC transporter permease [Streptococcus infantis]|uniref:ABC transporter permease n=1 Tax=Streptococcus infantis TaxID=68892 RepID=UPI001CBDB8B0|nr:ABC transporter permease [Streptococcus infantis]MBZ2120525.1 ABC transporter permease [Streptococcus infantis]MBZ2122344.1 ABC transporter permease [Streptococcus infantis]MBZ2126146.1 ABC transporter permease [Streptococcus infantis]